jgi:hypothetical protein
VSPERTAGRHHPLFPAAQRQLQRRGNPSLFNLTGLLFMVAADGVSLCHLVKCKELVKGFHKKILLGKYCEMVGNGGCVYNVCTILEKHLSSIYTCFL